MSSEFILHVGESNILNMTSPGLDNGLKSAGCYLFTWEVGTPSIISLLYTYTGALMIFPQLSEDANTVSTVLLSI